MLFAGPANPGTSFYSPCRDSSAHKSITSSESWDNKMKYHLSKLLSLGACLLLLFIDRQRKVTKLCLRNVRLLRCIYWRLWKIISCESLDHIQVGSWQMDLTQNYVFPALIFPNSSSPQEHLKEAKYKKWKTKKSFLKMTGFLLLLLALLPF